MPLRLTYSRGTIVVEGVPAPDMLRYLRYDPRIGKYRGLAITYPYLRRLCHEPECIDEVLQPPSCEFAARSSVALRDYQLEALERWIEGGMRGVVVLPPGTGKTIVGIEAIRRLRSATLVVVPTLDLMDQWVIRLREFFDVEIGRFGGGEKHLGCITVSTYDSAYINAELLGNKFLLIIFDEVHHLPSTGYRQIAELSAAPYRMGLTATPERSDGLHVDLPRLVGPVVYRRGVPELSGKYLSSYRLVRVYVSLKEDEEREYKALRRKFRDFFDRRGWRIRSLEDFQRLIMRSGVSREAREALLAWLRAREIVANSKAKLEKLSEILEWHRGERIIIFTDQNKLVHEISRRFLIPEITYRTPGPERREILEMFRRGVYKAVATSRVLEEGIDVPAANVAVILSGTGSSREFIQRLGRILRPAEGKEAILYEVVARETVEIYVSRRRRRGVKGASKTASKSRD